MNAPHYRPVGEPVVTDMATKYEGKEGAHPYRVPRDSATLIVLDNSEGAPRMLLGRRHQRHAFMPGKFVFPGGRVDRGDGDVAAAAELHSIVADKLMVAMKGRPSRRRARALAVAALRETYEEAGLLLGRACEEARSLSGEWAGFAEYGLAPCLCDLVLIGRAITPPGRPRRFDSRFFAVDRSCIAASLPGGVGPTEELDGLAWLTFEEARALDLPRITHVILDDLEERLARDGGLDPAAPAPFYFARNGRFLRQLV